ncbi:MAG TPA: phage tail protein [Candidatus Methylomirabilis sp.]|nr:phage tail protein [Candidatus Methylomirabilis sp.]
MGNGRQSRYLEYLPAIYQDREEPFLGQLLVPFEEVLTGFDALLSDLDRYFAPALTDREFLPWLADWVALVLDEEWDEPKRRRLIAEAVALYRERGTVGGLQRYLEIYTGLIPEIRECRWPGGMQIGVASMIGGTSPEDASLAHIERVERDEPNFWDYYVVTEPGRSFYYRTDQVKRVTVGGDFVEIQRLSDEVIRHASATVTRRDGLVEDLHRLTVLDEGGAERMVEYRGDTILVDEQELPYRFILDVRVPLADRDKVKLEKVRAIVNLEKPAHTVYYLKLTPVVSAYALQPMQVEVRSTVGADTILG